MAEEDIRIRFWGTRGSIPSPAIETDITAKNTELLQEFGEMIKLNPGRDISFETFLKTQPFWKKATFGGNTSCVEVLLDDQRFVFDMGSGARVLGNNLMQEMFAKGGIRAKICLSHTHWDHIQGIPFFGPLFVNKNTGEGIKNEFTIFGGTNYMEDIETCLQRQMEYRVFPVTWEYLKHINHHLGHHTIGDMEKFSIGKVDVLTRMLNHPGGSLGYQLSYKGKVIAYTTDNEPFDRETAHPPLVQLWQNADVVITDCQYLWKVYTGELGGVCRMGWGHSYPEAVAATAIRAGVKHIILFHHDPASSDERIAEIEHTTRQELCRRGNTSIKVTAAYDGMQLVL